MLGIIGREIFRSFAGEILGLVRSILEKKLDFWNESPEELLK